MKLSLGLFVLLGSSFSLMGQPSIRDQDEITVLLELIEMSQKNLVEQQTLLKNILDFRKQRQAFVQEPTSNRLATALVRSAMRIQGEIDGNHLSHLFSKDFLTEVRFFAQGGQEKKLSR